MVKDFERILNSDARGQFEWMDSVLVSALEKGNWILIDNVNLCSSSVLDRLNSVLETGGNLAINERGLLNGEIKIIVPHKNFRIFFAMDPRHGEISRAMRNRVVEICVTNLDTSSSASKCSEIALASSIGLPGDSFTGNRFQEFNIAKLKIKAAKMFRGKSLNSENNLDQSVLGGISIFRSIDVCRNSTISSAQVDGLILYWLLCRGSYPWQNQVDRAVPKADLELAACQIFIKRNSSTSTHIRRGWSKFMLQNVQNLSSKLKYHLESFLLPIPAAICDLRATCLFELGLLSIETELVIFH